MLPAVRVEYMLAQVAKMVVQSQGGMPEALLTDFLLRPRDPAAEPEMSAEFGAAAIAGMSGSKVIYLKKKERVDADLSS